MVALRSVGVFCGSSTPGDPAYASLARNVGSLLAKRGIELVYGGGRVGLMGELADACLGRGGRVIGVIPVGLFRREVAHTGVTTLHQVASMHERKQLMYDLSDAFIALPGGLGTLEELAEVTTWTQLGLHGKPLVLLDVDDFWAPLGAQLDRMVSVGVLSPENRDLLPRAPTAEGAIRILTRAEPVYVDKWITEGER